MLYNNRNDILLCSLAAALGVGAVSASAAPASSARAAVIDISEVYATAEGLGFLYMKDGVRVSCQEDRAHADGCAAVERLGIKIPLNWKTTEDVLRKSLPNGGVRVFARDQYGGFWRVDFERDALFTKDRNVPRDSFPQQNVVREYLFTASIRPLFAGYKVSSAGGDRLAAEGLADDAALDAARDQIAALNRDPQAASVASRILKQFSKSSNRRN